MSYRMWCIFSIIMAFIATAKQGFASELNFTQYALAFPADGAYCYGVSTDISGVCAKWYSVSPSRLGDITQDWWQWYMQRAYSSNQSCFQVGDFPCGFQPDFEGTSSITVGGLLTKRTISTTVQADVLLCQTSDCYNIVDLKAFSGPVKSLQSNMLTGSMLALSVNAFQQDASANGTLVANNGTVLVDSANQNCTGSGLGCFPPGTSVFSYQQSRSSSTELDNFSSPLGKVAEFTVNQILARAAAQQNSFTVEPRLLNDGSCVMLLTTEALCFELAQSAEPNWLLELPSCQNPTSTLLALGDVTSAETAFSLLVAGNRTGAATMFSTETVLAVQILLENCFFDPSAQLTNCQELLSLSALFDPSILFLSVNNRTAVAVNLSMSSAYGTIYENLEGVNIFDWDGVFSQKLAALQLSMCAYKTDGSAWQKLKSAVTTVLTDLSWAQLMLNISTAAINQNQGCLFNDRAGDVLGAVALNSILASAGSTTAGSTSSVNTVTGAILTVLLGMLALLGIVLSYKRVQKFAWLAKASSDEEVSSVADMVIAFFGGLGVVAATAVVIATDKTSMNTNKATLANGLQLVLQPVVRCGGVTALIVANIVQTQNAYYTQFIVEVAGAGVQFALLVGATVWELWSRRRLLST